MQPNKAEPQRGDTENFTPREIICAPVASGGRTITGIAESYLAFIQPSRVNLWITSLAVPPRWGSNRFGMLTHASGSRLFAATPPGWANLSSRLWR